MLSVYFTPDLPEGQAKAGEASQFASNLKKGKSMLVCVQGLIFEWVFQIRHYLIQYRLNK